MKIGIAQINTTPNDFQGNLKQIAKGIHQAIPEKLDVLLFPELSIPGYLVKDLVYRNSFIADNLAALQQVLEWSKKIPETNIVVGYVDRNNTGTGKPVRNMAAVIKNGLIRATYQKRRLPFYDVFDEGRYFEPGTESCIIEIGGEKCALTICEDIWNDKGPCARAYSIDPVKEAIDRGATVLLNISSSPFWQGKIHARLALLSGLAASSFRAVAYANQCGGQDELVFDGCSMILAGRNYPNNLSLHEIFPSEDGPLLLIRETEPHNDVASTPPNPVLGLNDSACLAYAIKQGIQDYVGKSKFTDVVIGSSGGIDSAVTLALSCWALGPEHVHAIMMPSSISSRESVEDAKALHQMLGCHEHLIPLTHTPFIEHIVRHLPPNQQKGYNSVADENIQARLRGMIIMFYSNAWGLMPLATGNKTELALGYCTLYGDMSGGFAPISDLYKGEVYQVAKFLNQEQYTLGVYMEIPETILNKPPSAELAPGQTDEKDLLPYSVLDAIVKLYVEQHVNTFGDFKEKTKWEDSNIEERVSEKKYLEIIRKIDNAEFKRRQAPPGIKLSSVAFGSGRRLPIIQKNCSHHLSEPAARKLLL